MAARPADSTELEAGQSIDVAVVASWHQAFVHAHGRAHGFEALCRCDRFGSRVMPWGVDQNDSLVAIDGCLLYTSDAADE